MRTASLGWLGGEAVNLLLTASGVTLDADPSFVRDGRTFGQYVSPILPIDHPFDVVSGAVDVVGQKGEVMLEARSSVDAIRWSSWQPMPQDGSPVALPVGRFLQYRLELTADALGAPVRVHDVQIQYASTGAAPAPAPSEHPTVRVFATREGMVGRKTANGRTIEERDRFAALPSRRVLNPQNAHDYQVRVSYKGRSTTVPIWDVGPWNTRDNYWDETRDLFSDLPRFVPQAFAAWKDNYNSGRDQFNRWVSFPASIDLADGTFLDDLGMRNSDYVDVTFLWVDAKSPVSSEMPVVAGLKPEPKAIGAAEEGKIWFFADGNTRPLIETFFTLYNPSDEPAKATLEYLTGGDTAVRQEVTLKEGSRLSIHANQVLPDAEFGVRVEATRSIVAERAVYVGGDGYSVTGVGTPGTTWYFAEGVTRPPFDTWIMVLNPGGSTANVNLTFMKDSGDNQTHSVAVPAASRYALRVADVVPDAGFSAKLVSDQPIVAERAVYLADGGVHGTAGAREIATDWYLAEGSTESGTDTWVLIQNPNRNSTDVTITYLRENGKPVEQRLSVGATTRTAVNVRQVLDGERFGVRVQADQPILVERSTYFAGAADGSGTGAHGTVAASETAKTWLMSDATTQNSARSLLALVNPTHDDSRVKLEVTTSDGKTLKRDFKLDAMRRHTVDLNELAPGTLLAVRISADKAIVAERTTYFDQFGATSTLGTSR